MPFHRARIIRRALVFLILGAIVNVAVAWGCAIWSPCKESIVGESDASAALNTWILSSEWFFESSDLLTLKGTGFKRISWASEHGGWEITQSGWPARSLEGATDWYSNFGWRQTTHRAIFAQKIISSVATSAYLPMNPIWPGFAINTIFYAGLFWALFAAPTLLCRKQRLKRGLCPACAYPIGSSPVCTECGQPISSTTPAPDRL